MQKTKQNTLAFLTKYNNKTKYLVIFKLKLRDLSLTMIFVLLIVKLEWALQKSAQN